MGLILSLLIWPLAIAIGILITYRSRPSLIVKGTIVILGWLALMTLVTGNLVMAAYCENGCGLRLALVGVAYLALIPTVLVLAWRAPPGDQGIDLEQK